MKKLVIYNTFLCVTLAVSIAFAAPAPSVPVTVTQSDGTTLTVRLFGDEFGLFVETLDGYTMVKDAARTWKYAVRGLDGNLSPTALTIGVGDPADIGLEPHIRPSQAILDDIKHRRREFNQNLRRFRPAGGSTATSLFSSESAQSASYPSSPEPAQFRLAVLLVRFPDVSNSYQTKNFNDLIFSEGRYRRSPERNEAYGSMNDYYQAMSYGQLSLTGNVFPWVTADNNRSYYDTPGTVGLLDEEAIAKTGVDLSQYDGYAVIYAGQYSTGSLWPHAGGNGNWGSYLMSELSIINPGADIAGFGTHAHEFGHVLGLPDLYNGVGDIGAMGLMGSGNYGGDQQSPWRPTQMSAWSKETMGWITPLEIHEANLTGVNLPPLADTGQVYKVISKRSHFLLSTRVQEDYDLLLPNAGLVIWQINPFGETWTTNALSMQVELEVSWNLGDWKWAPWPGDLNRTTFGCATAPNSRDIDGSCSVEITNIAFNGSDASFDLDVAWDGSPLGITVDGTGNYPSIYTAIASAQPDQTVSVPAGTYQEKIRMKNGVHVLGAGADLTIIDSPPTSSLNPVVNGASDTVFSGFSISCEGRSGFGYYYRLDWMTNALIANNTFEDCNFGIDMWRPFSDPYPEIINHASILNNVFYNNTVGVYYRTAAVALIENNLFVGNSYGAWGNVLTGENPASGTWVNFNDFFGNTNSDFGGTVPASFRGGDNLFVDPLLVDPANGDFYLGTGSPVMNAGDPDPTFNDTDASRNDLGAFGGPYLGNVLVAEICSDHFDNDGDGLVDDADTDCQAGCVVTEDPEITCDDAIDNDCDGMTDCADTADCGGDPACQGGTCDTYSDKGTCNDDPNCEWVGSPQNGTCQDAVVCVPDETPEATCTDEVDNDCDGMTDCADTADCGGDPACQGGTCSSYGDKASCINAGCTWSNKDKVCM